MKYDDLLTVPYKERGRTMDGMDCYGLILEMCRRNNTPLNDFVYAKNSIVSSSSLQECTYKVNVKEIPKSEANKGDLIQCTYNGNLHVGYMLDKKSIIHCTYSGVRVSPITFFSNIKYFKVV